MKRTVTFIIFSCLVLFLAFWAKSQVSGYFTPHNKEGRAQRIISLAPSITESLFALDLGDEVVGVTRFCTYPPEAQTKPIVAGFRDINFEALLLAAPDVIFIPKDRSENIDILENLGLKVVPLDTLTLHGLPKLIEKIGQVTGHEQDATQLLATFQAAITKAQKAAEQLEHAPGVLFVVMRAYDGVEDINDVSAVGRDRFYDELITLAGGYNVYKGDLAYPSLSKEAVLYLNPDVIIDVIAPGRDLVAARANWADLENVAAFKKDGYFITDRKEATVPGPRFPYILGHLSEMIVRAGQHPK